MSATNLAMASRRTAILALIGGLHVGAFVLVAGALLPRLLETLPADSAMRLLPRATVPEVRLRPIVPLPAEFAVALAPQPDIEIPQDAAVAIPSAVAPDASGAPSSEASPGSQAVSEAPALRIRDSRLTALVDACYPAAARRLGEEGRAAALVVVNPQGDVVRWSLSRSSGFPRLDGALDCVIRRLQFDPGRRAGTAVTAEVLLPVAFRLN
jgi:protein TonB